LSTGGADRQALAEGAAGAGDAVVACMKWVDRREDVDRLTGEVHTNHRTSGSSPADQAALEWALQAGEAWRRPVVAVCAGSAEVEPMLRDALAAGATGARLVEIDQEAPSDAVAAAVAAAVAGSCLVMCGAWSLDRGSGSFPAFLAAELGAAQALGAVGLEVDRGEGARLLVERRLDGGRRERLAVSAPAVVSVEASTARLRRASLGGVLAARRALIPRVAAARGTNPVRHAGERVRMGPFRPRSRVRPAPAGASPRDRVLALTGTASDRSAATVVTLEPAAAADALLEQLRAWGYLNP
jgi:electron transfer flavoprotein beta subunit